MGKVFLGILSGEDGRVEKRVPLGSLILRLSSTSLVVIRSVRRTYRMGSRLLSYPLLYSKSFSPSGLLKMVLILVYCQSVVPSTSLLKEDLARTCGNQSTYMVLENFADSKILVLD
jgi:hypothetical protein